ncbi:hypothetical protein SDRG_03032 [Saprolegnia diclina VS20]|uniref:Ataxin-10 domain-containing protein n=1 Tax=Saprolegnia diclina (strain VS20) TaxID=1156394 RepID=T0QNE1_SAPDV|nr:hypothetical protein SDRG_03032 [Saprolegnia diclina VS20]EQC39599.1 hypothetical protein SDRG_03032 [Saprolegnia diclina VS20]|eukprot:XP_008606871.1 hypothetical protein SDRG_03032 [Saprolegnia diclina VS20]
MSVDANPLLPLQVAFAALLEASIHPAIDDELVSFGTTDQAALRRAVECLPPAGASTALLATLQFVCHARAILSVCSNYIDQHSGPHETMAQLARLLPPTELDHGSRDDDGDDDADDELFLSPRNEPAVVPYCAPQAPPPRSVPPSWLDRLRELWNPNETDEATDEEMTITSPTTNNDDNETANVTSATPPVALPLHITTTIASMVDELSNLKLQLHALEALVTYITSASHGDSGALYADQRVLPCVLHAMRMLANSKRAQLAGLSLLGNPSLGALPAHASTQDCRRSILGAMLRFPAHPPLQGLGCLALANLCKNSSGVLDTVAKGGVDTAIAAMKRFPTDPTVQSSGCWLLATICAVDEEMQYAVLDAGGMAIVETAARSLPDDPRVHDHAKMALDGMLQKHPSRDTPQCLLQ